MCVLVTLVALNFMKTTHVHRSLLTVMGSAHLSINALVVAISFLLSTSRPAKCARTHVLLTLVTLSLIVATNALSPKLRVSATDSLVNAVAKAILLTPFPVLAKFALMRALVIHANTMTNKMAVHSVF
jgi:hypothetical protein